MKCCVHLCDQFINKKSKKSTSVTKKISFFRFPRKQSIRQLWLESIGVNHGQLLKNAMVCSQHFQKDDIIRSGGLEKLKNNAVPSIFKYKSNSVSVCVMCLNTNCKLLPFNKLVTEAYTSITGISKTRLLKINPDPLLCTECVQKLTNCNQFRDKSLCAFKLLKKLYDKHGTLKLENIEAIDRSDYKLTSNLATHSINPYYCGDQFEEGNEQDLIAAIKTEPKIVLKTKLKEEASSANDIAHYITIDNYNDGYNDTYDMNDDYNEAQVKNNIDNDHTYAVEYLDSDIDVDCDIDRDVNYNTDDNTNHDIEQNYDIGHNIENNTDYDVDHSLDYDIDQDNSLNNYDSMNSFNENKDYFKQVIDLTSNDDEFTPKAINKAVKRKRETKRTNIKKKTASKIKVKFVAKSKITKSNKKLNTKVNKVKKRKTKTNNKAKNGVKDEDSTKSDHRNILKRFKVTALSYEEQLAEVQKRKETYRRLPYQCGICCNGFSSAMLYERHKERHTDKYGIYECAVCGIHVKTRRKILIHINNQHGYRLTCKICKFVCHDKSRARTHMYWHNGRIYKCRYCGVEFMKKTTYFSHLRIKHPSDNVCSLCGFSFVSMKGLQCHQTMMHRFDDTSTMTGPQCAECNIRFASETAYQQHLKVSPRHAPEGSLQRNEPKYVHMNPYKKGETVGDPVLCELCGKSFKYPVTLRNHLVMHSGEKLHKCELCGKRFMFKLQLESHVRLHVDPKPYECNVCGERFTNYSNRRRHQLRHKESRPLYACELCDKKFTTSHWQRSHLKHVHGKVPYPKRVRKSRPGPRTKTREDSKDSQSS
ncbi:zinc finger protein 235 [Bicyclus anynana]|uniref:Zinc finger protein 235 n=1 Tax=Bicyclus anynana TaxID=110368 RepID=A0ABM3M3G4_BICAN|nr:zinc finger protein 235 [Bicyclus anynana]